MKKKLFSIVGMVIVVLAAWQLWPDVKTLPKDSVATGDVQTTSGPVRGFTQNGLDVFLGIPYAEPPVGSLRFKSPVAHEPWQKTFNAYEFGAFCPQAYDPVVIDDPNEELNNEDCLYLNIWKPSDSQEKRAVMVYIHGGGFVGGSSKEDLYNGSVIAKEGDVIVVTINYRVGILGFFDFSAIGGPEYAGSADAGIEDQILALRWVKDNIAAFGGDPQNITVFGESAGGASLLSLLGTEHPQDLFKRAIVMSGSPLHTAENSRAIANLIKDQTGITSPFIWTKAPTRALMYIQDQVLSAVGSPLSDLIFAPTYGSDFVVKQSPLEAIASGNTAGIELMIGNMADELSYWSFYDTPDSHICEQTLKENLFTMIDPGIEPKLKELYDLYAQDPQRVWRSEGDIILAMGDDYAFRVDALNVASKQSEVANTYYYRFNYPINLPEQPCQDRRSPHGAELPFVFGSVNTQAGFDFIGKPRDEQDNAARNALMHQSILVWTNFARTGDPNGGDMPEWTVFDPDTQPTMVFEEEMHIENAPFNEEYKAMSEFMKSFNVFDALR
ncbi:MAG: carboxylesterase family protein [Anaerolineales bacterium]|nr:carboxylesterase family protein [Anaerolineales bacterium]